MKKYIGIFLALTAGYCLAFFIHGPLYAQLSMGKFESNRDIYNGAKLTNPYLDTSSKSEYNNLLYKFKKDADSYIRKMQKQDSTLRVSYYVQDLQKGSWVGLREKESFHPASLSKLPIFMYIISLAERDNTIFSKKITYTSSEITSKDNLSTEREALGLEYVEGQEYLVGDLMDRMIIYSDNYATNMLNREFGPAQVGAFVNSINFIFDEKTKNGGFTPKSYASLFRIMYNSSLYSRTLSEMALGALSDSQMDRGLRANLPNDIVMASKFGFFSEQGQGILEQQFHDCGIVYAPQSPLLVCIFTSSDTQNGGELMTIVEELSLVLYKKFNLR